jgi:hypothetical protein
MNYDSPAMLNMLNEGSGGLGGVPMGGVNMDISLSQLGIPSASAMGRADEAERARRLHNIIDTLKQKPGRVSEENVLALCTRLGTEYAKEGEGTYLLPIGDSNILDVSARFTLIYNGQTTDLFRLFSVTTRSKRSSCRVASTTGTPTFDLAKQARRSLHAT